MMNDFMAMLNTPICADWRGFCAAIPDGVVDLLFLDPPYNIGVFCKMEPAEYLAWCCEWIAEGDRILAPNGAFWVSHKDPTVLVDISREIARLGRGRINWVTWDKYNAADDLQGFMDGYTVVDSLRSFQVMAEYLVYHADEGDWTAQCDRERGFIFEPLRVYLAGEWGRAGLKFAQANEACGTASMAARHFFSRSQWCLPTEEHYHALRVYANAHSHGGEYLRREYEYLRREYEDLRREYEDLRREYEDLRREYEDLRYTFNNPGKVSSVWQIPPAPRNGHPTPKPPALLARIIEATSSPGDLVCDFFAGSFTTAAEAQRLGRRWLCCDKSAEYVDKFGRRPFEPQQMAMGLGG
jgi:adenine-specific DNA-methyltransferase